MQLASINSPYGKKLDKNPHHIQKQSVNRSKSTFSFQKIRNQINTPNPHHPLKSNHISRVRSAIKLKNIEEIHKLQQSSVSKTTLPKMTKGKLHLGKQSKPNYILPNEIRNNPWGKPNPISEQILAKKGLMEAINMGILPKGADFTQLLNNKFQIVLPNTGEEQSKGEQFFATNPIINETQQEDVKEGLTQDRGFKQQVPAAKSPKKKKKKVKKITTRKPNNEINIEDFLPRTKILKLDNFQVVKDQEYYQELKLSMAKGNDVDFKIFINQVQGFAVKYKIRKFEFELDLNTTKKMTDFKICSLIQNYKPKGVYLTLIGGVQRRSLQTAKMILYRFRYKRARKNLDKLENIKKFFKVKKFYQEMAERRLNFLKYKFGSFIETQRRFLEEVAETKTHTNFMKYRVQVHIPLIDAGNNEHKKSFYKLYERNNIQLTQMFSINPQYLIILTQNAHSDGQQRELYFEPWLKLLNGFKSYHPKVTLIGVNACDRIKCVTNNHGALYYSLSSQDGSKMKKIIKSVKNKNKQAEMGVITSGFENVTVKICEFLDVKLCGGSFIDENIKLIQKEEQEENQSIENEPHKTKVDIISTLKEKARELNKFTLINHYFNDKIHIKKSLAQSNLPTPYFITFKVKSDSTPKHHQQSISQFLFNLSQSIIINKEINFWIFKLRSESRFSRGLGLLETDSLKIVKDKKKKPKIQRQDIEELSRVIRSIIHDKMIVPQNSLHDRKEFIEKFFSEGGYAQQFKENIGSFCLFGNLHPSGQYQHIGTYEKIYTDSLVNCAALYPGSQITQHQINAVEQFCKDIFTKYKMYGKITIETVLDRKSSKFYYIDIVPHIQQYSSLQYFYSKCFSEGEQKQEMKILKNYQKSKQQQKKSSTPKKTFVNQLIPLKRKILYCPFIDNNGNKFEDFGTFQDACQTRRLKMDYKYLQGIQFFYLNLKQKIPDALSILTMGNTQKKAFKLCLDGLNFLIESSEKSNRFDKKVERGHYDCIFIHDIIWKMRAIKKNLDTLEITAKNKQNDFKI